MERNDRLRASREKLFDTAKEAALALGVPYPTYHAHEKGNRGIKDGELELYARRFRVSLPWLAFGHGEPEPRSAYTVQVVGFVGAGAEISVDVEQMPSGGHYDIETILPLPPGVIAFEVVGDSMYPRYDPGDVIICHEGGLPVADLRDGKEAAVLLEDGRRFLKRVVRESPSTFTLESHNAPPIRGVRLSWASDIMFIIPVDRWSKASNGRTTAHPKRGG